MTPWRSIIEWEQPMVAKRADMMSNRILGWFRQHTPEFEIPGFVNVEKIAETIFSTIYRAYELQLERWVAIKVLPPSFGRMFERERKALGRLSDHPHVVSVFRAGVGKSGNPYIVMEYLPAGSLADRLRTDGPLPWHEALAIGAKLAGALQSAHHAGILHLDLKPANILISPDGEPKLADFGIAHLRATLGLETQTLGFTPGYSAPELFEEGEPTTACDIYGLGATLFALLKGHPPFLRSPHEGPTSVEVIIGRMLFEPVPELDSGFPDAVRALVHRAIARSPQDRFASAAELGEALQAAQRAHGLAATPPIVVPVAPVPPQPPLPARPPRWRLATAGLLLALTPAADALHALAGPTTCAQPNTVQADGVLSFGTLLPRTGQFSFSGPALEASVDLAIADINAAGGIPGIAIRLDPSNQHDEGNPFTDTASKAASPLLDAGVDVIIGPSASAAALTAIDTITCAGVIMFSPSNSSPVFTTYADHGLYFRTGPSDVIQGRTLGELVVADGNSTAVVISRDDAYGNGLRETTAQTIEDRGGEVVDSFSYNPEALHFDGEVQRIKTKNPDAIVVIGFRESAQLLRTMVEQDLGPQHKRVYGADGNMDDTLARQVNPQEPGILSGMRGTIPYLGSPAFLARLRDSYPGLQDLIWGAEAYDVVIITALAAATARTDAPAAIAEQINGVTKDGEKCTSYADCTKLIQQGNDIDYDGASGPLDFTDPGEPSSATYAIVEIQADGFRTILDTRTAATPS